VDPLAHGLLFERFLNPERISMPDIDIDFCFERRGEIIDYVNRKYGPESVCQIITYGAMLARGVIRDVGRAFGMTYGEVDRIAKMVPEQLGITLEKALQDSPELREVRAEDPRYDRLLDTALSLEGLYRHASIHAAGVLIAPGSLTDHVPLHRGAKHEITTQWDMKMVEKMGLLKMDFLGLRTLTVIDKALDFVREEDPAWRDRTATDIPLDDPAVYEMLSRGETVGVFQLESSGMQEVLRKLKPTKFEDITAVNALYRPGPLGSGMVDDFIERKHGRRRIEYDHPMLAPILEETYGVILYQEQVMRIAGEMAGFSMGQADRLRKAMGKKKVDQMEEMAKLFVDGSAERGVERGTAQRIFDLMAYFAGYGFNKSHSASYAVLSVRTAWLKAHHPAAFLAATLTSEMNSTDRVVTLVDEARHLGIELLPPDVNTCTADFKASEGRIRFGLGAVKNVGLGAIEAVVEARERLGRSFESLYEFCEEVDPSRVNRRVLESLVLSGAMDTIPGRREQKLAALDLALGRAVRKQRDRRRGQSSLFGGLGEGPGEAAPGEVLPEVAPWDEDERLAKEKELIGFYLTGHPLDPHRRLLGWLRPDSTRDLAGRADDAPLTICGVSHALKTVTTRSSGRVMAFLTLEDLDGSCEVICFPDAYEEYREKLNTPDALLVVAGRCSAREGEEPKLVLEKAWSLEEACGALIRQLRVDVPADLPAATVDALLETVRSRPGRIPLHLRVRHGGFEAEVRASRILVHPHPRLLRALADLLGPDAVHPVCLPLGSLAPAEEGGGRRRRRAAARMAAEAPGAPR
jgi:DNA polymerase-3 subunit alpha